MNPQNSFSPPDSGAAPEAGGGSLHGPAPAGESPSPTAAAMPPPSEAHSTEVVYQPLDPRVVKLWQLTSVIGSLILLGLAAIPVLGISLSVPELFPWLIGAWLALAALRTWLFFWSPKRRFENWGYALDEKVLLVKSGVIFKVIRLLPLSRLQHVDLHRGPLERAFGLATLTLHTAGTQQSVILIPGLSASKAAELRDHLVAIGGDDAV